MIDKNDQDNDPLDDLDFEDDSWEDFDASEEEGLDAEDALQDSVPSGPAAKNRTFLQKNFNFIVIGLVGIAGGLVYLQFAGGSRDIQTAAPPDVEVVSPLQGEDSVAQISGDIPELSADLPPMPARIENTDSQNIAPAQKDFSLQDSALSSEMVAVNEDQGETSGFEDSDVLTPLPDLAADSTDDLADLGDFSANGFSDEEIVPPADTSLQDSTALPDVQEDAGADVALSDMQQDDSFASNDDDRLAMDSNPDEEDFSVESLESADHTAFSDMERQIEDLNETLSSSQIQLQDAQKAEDRLSEDLQQANSKIQSLNAEIDALRGEIETLRAAEQTVIHENSQDMSPPEDHIQEQRGSDQALSADSSPQHPPSAVVSPPSPASDIQPKWTLRSAGPGRAVISPQDGSDMRQVEIGDNVPGLGRIRSISVENGRWVVRGENGSVLQ